MTDVPLPSRASGPRAPRGRDVALAELRDHEAQRQLGLLTPGELPDRARQWRQDGLDDERVDALAESDTCPDVERSRLLREAAEALGLGFERLRDARAHHAEVVIASMSATSASAAALAFSNGVTDAFEESTKQRLSRLFRPGS